jgi:O-antigen/teichoic acid export membrane protein
LTYKEIKYHIDRYLKHRTFKNVGFLTLGQGLAQVVSLIGAFYIPRLLGPEKYGTYQTVIAYVGLFSVLTFGGLNKVILRESSRNLNKIREILEATIGLKHLFSFFAILICSVIAIFIDYEKGTKIYILIFSFSLWLKALDGTFNVIYQAHEKMKYMAILSFLKPLMIVPA